MDGYWVSNVIRQYAAGGDHNVNSTASWKPAQ